MLSYMTTIDQDLRERLHAGPADKGQSSPLPTRRSWLLRAAGAFSEPATALLEAGGRDSLYLVRTEPSKSAHLHDGDPSLVDPLPNGCHAAAQYFRGLFYREESSCQVVLRLHHCHALSKLAKKSSHEESLSFSEESGFL